MNLDQTFWNERYLVNDTPWDIGEISPPLKDFFDKLEDQELKILIPGAGRAHEAIYLFEKGFHNVHVCDWAPDAFDTLKHQCPKFPTGQIIISDFFKINEKFDIIVEQTFFCALLPSDRVRYATKVAGLLNGNGMVAGLLFANNFDSPGPPYGGTKEEYISLFSPYFQIECMDMTQNSIRSRMGNELFFKMKPIEQAD